MPKGKKRQMEEQTQARAASAYPLNASWVDTGDLPRSEGFKKMVRIDHPYPYEGGDLIEAGYALAAVVKSQSVALKNLSAEKKKRRTADLDHLTKANKVKTDREKKLTIRVGAQVKKTWHGLPDDRQRSVHNITKILCNPKGAKRASTQKMEWWKYRWIYKKHTEIIPFWTIRRYVKDAVKALKAASA